MKLVCTIIVYYGVAGHGKGLVDAMSEKSITKYDIDIKAVLPKCQRSIY